MIDLTHYPGFVAGLLTGYVHTAMLWQSSHRLSALSAALGMLRLGIVATALVCAAVYGQILAAAAGWAISFSVSAVLHLGLGPRHAQLFGKSNSVESRGAKCN